MERYYNGYTIFYDYKKKSFCLTDKDIFIEDNIVFDIGNFHKVEKEYNLNGNIIIPSFINAHIHLGETYLRPLEKQMTLLEYISFGEQQNKLLKNKQDTWDYSAHTTINEAVQSGTFVLNTLRGVHVLKNYKYTFYSGMPIMLSEKLKGLYDKGIEGFKHFCSECKENNIVPGVFFHSFYANNEQSFLLAQKCNNISKTFFAVHIAEDNESENMVIKRWGKTSIQILLENNLLNNKSILIHGNVLTNNELKLLSQKQANLVVCPISSYNLGNKIVDPEKLSSMSINWSIATDGLATGVTANMLEQARFVSQNFSIPPTKILEALTINPEKALGLSKEVFSKNSKANFIILDKVNFKDIDDLLLKIFNGYAKIKNCIFNGKVLTFADC